MPSASSPIGLRKPVANGHERSDHVLFIWQRAGTAKARLQDQSRQPGLFPGGRLIGPRYPVASSNGNQPSPSTASALDVQDRRNVALAAPQARHPCAQDRRCGGGPPGRPHPAGAHAEIW